MDGRALVGVCAGHGLDSAADVRPLSFQVGEARTQYGEHAGVLGAPCGEAGDADYGRVADLGDDGRRDIIFLGVE